MEKIEIVGELKRSVLTKVQNREGIPENVKSLIDKSHDNILELYKQIGCSNESIKAYIDENKEQTKSNIKSIGENRKSQEIEKIYYIIRGIQREIEKQEENKQQHKQEIKEIQIDDERYAHRIGYNVIDSLKNIQSRQNGILSSMGYTDDRIRQINESVDQYINNIKIKQEDKINKLLNGDKDQLISQVLEQYDEFYEKLIEEDKNIEKKEDTEHQENKQESFREELSSGKSLEEQREYVNEILKQEQEKGEGEVLPGDILL